MSGIDKVYSPEVIEELPFPMGDSGDLMVSTPASGREGDKTFETERIEDFPIPTKQVAVELLSNALNTRSKKILQEFQFTPSGALQIGDYTDGESGDIRISPTGIIARNVSGTTTFLLDGETGDAFFTGTLRSQSLISGSVIVGDSDIIIDGENKRMVFYDDTGRAVIVIGEL